jgi:ribonuclease BN (tRNA processing enzyme)
VELEVVGFRVGAPLNGACPCYAVRDGETCILLDFGPGALERTWENGLLGEVDAIVISHMHMDHALYLLPLSGELTQIALRERYPDRPRMRLYVPRDHGPAALDALAGAVGSSPGRFEEADLLLLEATYVEHGPEVERNGHMTGEQAASLAERSGARRLLLTHVGPWTERNEENLRRAGTRFSREVELVHEGARHTEDDTDDE